jgi:16S rRNA (cytosine967-C5)-methyltransferase
MIPAARLSAALEVLTAIETDRIPAANALKAWGTAHRFAGSGDRSAIAGLVFDVLRRQSSAAYLMGEETPRARLLGMLRLERNMDEDAIAAMCDGSRFAPSELSDKERRALESANLDGAPAYIAGDYPEWLDASLASVFGEDRVAEGVALASRAPLDLRVNTLKATRGEMLKSLAHLNVTPTPYSPLGLRIQLGADARNRRASSRRRLSSRAALKFRTKALRSRRCLSKAKPGQHRDRPVRGRGRQDAGAWRR